MDNTQHRMRVTVEDAATPVYAVEVGARLRLRRTGEVREVVELFRRLTERRFVLDDGTHIDAMVFDTVYVTNEQVSAVDPEPWVDDNLGDGGLPRRRMRTPRAEHPSRSASSRG